MEEMTRKPTPESWNERAGLCHVVAIGVSSIERFFGEWIVARRATQLEVHAVNPLQRLDASGKVDLDRRGVSAKRFHSVVSWMDQRLLVVSWMDQRCSACMSRKLYMNMFFCCSCCELVHGVCFVVGFGLFVSAAIFPNDDMAKI